MRVGSFSGAFLAARIAENDNDLASAVHYYRRALSFDPGNRAIQQSLLLGLISLGRFDDALPIAEDLKDVPEVERFSRLALGVDALRKGNYGDAETLLKLSLESDLDRLITGLAGAWALAGQGNAEAALERITALSGPDWYELFTTYHRALLADHLGDAETAREAYAAVVGNAAAGGAAPEVYLRAMEANASFLARQGAGDEALGVLERAAEVSPTRVSVHALRAMIEAGEAPPLSAVRTPASGASEVLLNLASALNRGGGESFVRLYLHYALALNPESDAVLIQLAAVAEQQQKPADAVEFYARIPASSPLKRIAEMQMGLNLADLERHDEAIEHLAALVESDPDDMRAYLALGGVHASRKDYAAAAALYERAVARIDEPTQADWNVFYQRGIAYERLKQWSRAEPNFKKALELNPDQPQVLNYLGYSWVDMNMNLDQGLEMIKRAVELRPSDGYIVDSLGWAYYRLERFDDAVRELERAVNLMPNDPILADHLGDAYWRVGRRLEATFQWRHARDLDPEPDVLESVERKLRDGMPSLEEERAANERSRQEALAANLVPIPEGLGGQNGAVEGPVETVASGNAVHIVLPGQSLWSISLEVFGDGNRYPEILELNPQLRGDPGRIVPGQELRLPAN